MNGHAVNDPAVNADLGLTDLSTSADRAAQATAPPSPVDALRLLAEGCDLTRAQAASVVEQIVSGGLDDTQVAALLMGLRVKGETADEIAGFADGMRRAAVTVDSAHRGVLVDIVGTGGDSLGTFNISTTAAFVVAGAGVKVAKHGNRAASSQCGSADVLEALGIDIGLGPLEIASCIDEVGMGFMFAAAHHPAAGRVAGVRRSLGVRTVFNLLGPLTNPAGVRRQLIGVSSPRYLRVLGEALACTGCEHALVVCGDMGMDELSVTGPAEVVEVKSGVVGRAFHIVPEDYGLPRHPLSALAGGDGRANAAITKAVLDGRPGGPRDAVLLNAAAALYVAGSASSVAEGMEAARLSIDSGRARNVLERMVIVTNRLGAGRPAADRPGAGPLGGKT